MPICIGNYGSLADGTTAYVSGFGDTVNRQEGEDFQASEYLNSVDVLIIEKDKCQKWYSDDLIIQNDQICAGHEGGGKDSCVGDSGGPLVKSTQRYYLSFFRNLQ